MRDLHVVGMSEDGRHVLLATTRDAVRGGFRVLLDDRLAAAVRGELPRPGETAPPVNPMSVKEIQARLRAGESVEELARAGGVPLSRVERFAGPVLSERAQVVEAARRAVLVRGRRGPSALPLGEAVDLRLSELPSMRADSVEWTAFKGDDGRWTVQVSWYSRGRTRQAQWHYDVAARTVAAVDPGSAALAHVDPAGRRGSAEGDAAAAPARSTSRSRAAGGTTAAAAGPTSAAARPARRGGSARSGTRTASARGTGTRAATPATAVSATDVPATRAPAASRPAAAAARAGSPRAAGSARPAPAVGPAVAAGPPAAARPAAAGSTAARRASGDETALRSDLETPSSTPSSTLSPAASAPAGPARTVSAAASGAARRPAGTVVPAPGSRRPRPEAEAPQAADRPGAEAPQVAEAEERVRRTEEHRPQTDEPAAGERELPVVDAPSEEQAAPAAAQTTLAPAEAPVRSADGPAAPAAEDRDADEDVPPGPPALRVVPPPEEPEPARPAARKGRASVPTWADVLLSTAPPKEQEQD